MKAALGGLLAAALSAAAVAAPTAPARDPRAVREVLARRRKVANAAWWGFDPQNATAALQAAIRSGAAKVLVPNMGRPWLVDPVFLESDQELDLEPGVEIRARSGAYLGKNDELFKLERKSNVVIKGYGAALRMRKDDYRKPPYAASEWRDVLGIYGGTNVQILGLALADGGGDGIYIAGGGPGRPASRNILIKDVVSEGNFRQALSVISVDGLRVEDTVLRGTEGTAPAAGVDFEPNGPTDRLSGIQLKRCVIENNRGYGIQVGLERMPADFPPVEIDVEGGSVSGNGSGALLVYPGAVKGVLSLRAVKLDGRRTVKRTGSFTVRVDS
jgi:polygalacturonase